MGQREQFWQATARDVADLFPWAFASDDVEEIYPADENWDYSVIKLGKAPIEFRLAEIDLPGVSLQLDRQSAGARAIYTKRFDKFYTGTMIANAAGHIWDGRPLDDAQFVVLNQGQHDIFCPENGARLNVEIDADLARKTGLSALPSGVWNSNPADHTRFVDMCIGFIAEANLRPEQTLTPQQATQRARRIIDGLTRCLTTPVSPERPGYYATVRRAEDLLEACGWETDMALDRMSDALGMSRRTLHRAFDEMLGMGPASYIRLVRLHNFHRALRDAPAGCSVTDAALEAGFDHFGRASRYYRDHFGQRPKDVLRQMAGA